jgi:hypothetical protein
MPEMGVEAAMIDVLEIQEKQKPHPLGIASPDDFSYRKVGEADPSVIVTDPTISLYCLDHASRRAFFVQVPEDIDVTAPPFLYMAQYDHASRLLSVPYELFHRVAADVDMRAPLVLIHSTGRAGSTLMSRAFAEMASVTSLSEPDVYTQAVAMRLSGDDDEIPDLLASATRILLNPAFTCGSSLNVIKFRSQCMEVADLLYDSFPHAGNLFLYRDLNAYLQSSLRAFAIDELPPEAVHQVASFLAATSPLLTDELQQRADLDGIAIPCLIWLSAVHAYARMHQRGMPMLAVRYEELIADPRSTLATILAYLGLPIDEVDSALRAFARDSQAGSPLSREEAASRTGEIDAHRWDVVRDLLRRYPIVGAELPAAALATP